MFYVRLTGVSLCSFRKGKTEETLVTTEKENLGPTMPTVVHRLDSTPTFLRQYTFLHIR